jgi:hypothetical protein
MTARPLASATDADLLGEVRDLFDAIDPVPAAVIDATRSALTAQPVQYSVTRFKCPFCGRSRSTRPPIVEHIARCWKNPDAHACLTCQHFERQAPEPEVGFYGMEWCGAQDAELIQGVVTGCPLWALRGAS